MATITQEPYPVRFSVDYPDRDLNRLTSLLRIITIIPIAILQGTITNGLLSTPTALMLIFRHKYPRWWFDWNLALMQFSYRISSYLFLLRDEYPSTDEEQAVHLSIPYPNVQVELNRWLPLVKWFLAIPHYIVLFFLGIAAIVCVLIAWVAILITGRYPRSLFDFVSGVMRWFARVTAYAFVLSTDKYPPFRLGD